MFGKNKKSDNQEDKLNLLIESWYKSLELHNKIYDALNKKIMWFFTLISATEWYLFINFFITKDFLNHCVLIKILFFFLF